MNQPTVSKKKLIQLFAGTLSAFLLIFLDRITKQLAVEHLKNAPAVPILPGVFELSYLENHGAAFGILQDQRIFFIVMTILVLAVLLYLYARIPEEKRYFSMRLILVLLISGAIGNFIDRCVNKYVIDFFYFKLINFPVFNIADIYVVASAALMIVLFCFYYTEEDIELLFAMLPFHKKKENR